MAVVCMSSKPTNRCSNKTESNTKKKWIKNKQTFQNHAVGINLIKLWKHNSLTIIVRKIRKMEYRSRAENMEIVYLFTVNYFNGCLSTSIFDNFKWMLIDFSNESGSSVTKFMTYYSISCSFSGWFYFRNWCSV